MLSKSILKYFQSLHHKKFREEHGVFVAEGPKVVAELLQSNKFLCRMICGLHGWIDENEPSLTKINKEDKHVITDGELGKISKLQTPNKVAAIFLKREEKLTDLKNKLSLLLDDIQDPGNMGTVIRIADWFGIENIICSKDCTEHYNPKVVQSSMGSIASVNILYTDLEKFIKDNEPINVYAASLSGTSLYNFKKITEGFLVIGNESKGVSNELLSLAKEQITIPRIGNAESLNAAVAAGIIVSYFKS